MNSHTHTQHLFAELGVIKF